MSKILLLLFVLVSCAPKLSVDGDPLSSSLYYQNRQKVLNYFEISDTSDLLRRNIRATVALMYRRSFYGNDENGYTLNGTRPYEYNLCSQADFPMQPAAAFCSGVLVAPDVVATAGHCIRSEEYCQENVRLVFDYYNTGSYQKFGSTFYSYNKLYTSAQFYSCKKVIKFVEDPILGDYALIKLDHPVVDREPIEVGGKAGVGTELYTLGFPKGTPLKYSFGASYKEKIRDSFFASDLEVFKGNSGGPIINAKTHKLEGLLSTTHLYRGENGELVSDELIKDVELNCSRLKRLSDGEAEQLPSVTSVKAFSNLIPDQSARLEVEKVIVKYQAEGEYLRPGQSFSIQFQLFNISSEEASDISVELIKEGNENANRYLSFLEKRQPVVDLKGFAKGINQSPLLLNLGKRALCGDFLELKALIGYTAENGKRKQLVHSFIVPVGKLITKSYSASELPVVLESSHYETSIEVNDVDTFIHSISFPIMIKFSGWNQPNLILISPKGERYFLYNQMNRGYLMGIINQDIPSISDLSKLIRTSPKGKWYLSLEEDMSYEKEFINWGMEITTSSCN